MYTTAAAAGDYSGAIPTPDNPGHCCAGTAKLGERGMASLVAIELRPFEFNFSSPNQIFIQFFPKGLGAWIHGNVYIPQRQLGEARTVALKTLARTLGPISNKNLSVIVGGDFNMKMGVLNKWLLRGGRGFESLKVRGSNLTYHSRWGKGKSDIDHFIVNESAARQLLNNTPKLLCRPYPNWMHVRWNTLLHLDDNRWNTWLHLEHEYGRATQECYDKFVSVATSIAKEAGALSTKPTPRLRAGCRLEPRARRLINARRKAWNKVRNKVANTRAGRQAVREYKAIALHAKAAVRDSNQRSFERFVEKWNELLREGQMKKFFAHLKKIVGKGQGTIANQPLNANGELVMEPERQSQVWEGHYSKVFADTDGTSKDPLAWYDKHVRIWPGMPEVCDLLNWYELREACRRLKRHKATGGDGLPPEFFKLLLKDKGLRSDPRKPRSEMGKAYLHMIEGIYDTGDIPAGASGAVIVSIPKKGDLTNTDNYRGITLISVAIKVLTMVMIRRITKILEKRYFFNPGQADFRTNEECIGQVACLKEIVKLRHKDEKPTYAAYIDFKKAYDTISHEALFLKLPVASLRGRALRFFQAPLYRSTSVKVQHMEQLSDSIPVQWGVRQGCSRSPCLFNIYINDILDADGETWGLGVPNLLKRIKGLLFADDVVLLADSPESLQTSLDKVSEWAKTWGMTFGIDKCMVTVFHGDLQDLSMRIFILGGEMVAVGETYKSSLTYERPLMGGTYLLHKSHDHVTLATPHQVIRAPSPVSSSTICIPTYGVLPCTRSIIGGIFLLAIYGYIIFTAARFLVQGSELLLLVLDTNIVGGLLLPIFGVLPDAVLVLVTGLGGSKAEAQEEVLVGIGLIAGSNVMLLTLLWGLCLIIGRCDLQKDVNGKVHAIDKQLHKKFSLFGTGAELDKWTRISAGIMCISIIPYLVAQIPHIFHASPTNHIGVLIACILSIGGLLIYCIYQVMVPSFKKRKKLKALQNLITFNVIKFSQREGNIVGHRGEVNEHILKRVFDLLDVDNDGSLTRDEVRVMLAVASFKERINEHVVDHFMHRLDTNNSNTISWQEFLKGMIEWCKNVKPTHLRSLSTLELFKMEEDVEIIEDLVERELEFSPLTKTQVIKKSIILLLLGVVLIGVFAEPMVDAVTDFSRASHIPSFFVSFVFLPIASNASEGIASIIFASRKQQVNMWLTYSQIYGAVTMNNTMSLGTLLAIIYVRRLEWNFSSEVLIICLITLIVGVLALTQRVLRVWISGLALLLYPLAIALVSIFDYVVGWK
ncbi:hypothetical protein GOP47_0020025 [Adiantum capillus-veneris]|uniref:Uncharacterized protein n=1 Tax=Adiantum capillus-veneris TaxID=13818 RepID=A0A9D4UCF3_ADICA|nr:hypothetical protein GOP47_0020025 [Adiantum capillus-veneris]